MPRYHRVNIDGKSLYKTETRLTVAALLPGTAAYIDPANDKFTQAAAATTGRLYIIGSADHQGLAITDAAPAGNSAVGNYLEEGREFAVLCVAGTYKKDTPIKIAAGGQGAVATPATEAFIGFSQDDVVLAAGDFIRVRIQQHAKPAA